MSAPAPEPEYSASGSPIYRYENVEPEPFSFALGHEEGIEAITQHVEQHVGPIASVFHEIISDKVHLDVHIVAPTPDFPFYTLVTSGMSDLPMNVADAPGSPAYAELCFLLPSTWPLADVGEAGLTQTDEAYWPISWLKYIARFPHEYRTWLGFGHTLPNGEQAAPYAADTKLGCMLLLPSISLPEAFRELRVSDEKTIHFYALYPIYKEEMKLKMNQGVDALLTKFEEFGISDVLDVTRPNVAKKKGLLGLW